VHLNYATSKRAGLVVRGGAGPDALHPFLGPMPSHFHSTLKGAGRHQPGLLPGVQGLGVTKYSCSGTAAKPVRWVVIFDYRGPSGILYRQDPQSRPQLSPALPRRRPELGAVVPVRPAPAATVFLPKLRADRRESATRWPTASANAVPALPRGRLLWNSILVFDRGRSSVCRPTGGPSRS